MPITLVPETLARRGHRFTFVGPNTTECVACPFQKLCFGLEPGRTYQVTALRDMTHPCVLHEEGKVRVVEAEETHFESSLEKKHMRGTAAPWTPVACGRPECPSYGLCHPVGGRPGKRHAIVQDLGTLACPAGFDLARVRLHAME